MKDKTVTITKPTLKDKDVDFEYFVDEKYKGHAVYSKSKGSLEMITDIGFSTK